MSSDEIHIKQWVRRGILMVNTDALEFDDPDSPWNQASAQGVDPEDFGMSHPLHEEFKDRSHSSLAREVIELRRDLVAAERYLAAV